MTYWDGFAAAVGVVVAAVVVYGSIVVIVVDVGSVIAALVGFVVNDAIAAVGVDAVVVGEVYGAVVVVPVVDVDWAAKHRKQLFILRMLNVFICSCPLIG